MSDQYNNHRALLAPDELLRERRIDPYALPLQAAIGQQAIGSLDTVLLFGLAGNGPPKMGHRQHLPWRAAITFTKSAVRRSLCISEQTF